MEIFREVKGIPEPSETTDAARDGDSRAECVAERPTGKDVEVSEQAAMRIQRQHSGDFAGADSGRLTISAANDSGAPNTISNNEPEA